MNLPIGSLLSLSSIAVLFFQLNCFSMSRSRRKKNFFQVLKISRWMNLLSPRTLLHSPLKHQSVRMLLEFLCLPSLIIRNRIRFSVKEIIQCLSNSFHFLCWTRRSFHKINRQNGSSMRLFSLADHFCSAEWSNKGFYSLRRLLWFDVWEKRDDLINYCIPRNGKNSYGWISSSGLSQSMVLIFFLLVFEREKRSKSMAFLATYYLSNYLSALFWWHFRCIRSFLTRVKGSLRVCLKLSMNIECESTDKSLRGRRQESMVKSKCHSI